MAFSKMDISQHALRKHGMPRIKHAKLAKFARSNIEAIIC